MRYTSLKLKNFTVFRDVKLEFGNRVNVFIGANGTGKTHLLKLLYSLQLSASRNSAFILDLFGVYHVSSAGDLVRARRGVSSSEIEARGDDIEMGISLSRDGSGSGHVGPVRLPRPVFIPSIDMLAHTNRFLSTYDEFNIDFDQTHRDFVALLLSPEKRTINDLGIDLAQLTGGAASGVEEKDERFYIDTPGGKFLAQLVSEGIRKLSSIYVLLSNGWIRPGTAIMWDEPEASISPGLMAELIRTILTFANSDVQVFLATHSYGVLKELDLQAKPGDVRYFALELVGNEAAVHPADSYDELSPNKIAEAFDSIYDRQLARATGRWRKNGDGR